LFALPLLTGCGAFATDSGIYPLPTVRIVFPSPDFFGLEYDILELETPRGTVNFAWFIPAENARATVVFHHGAVINRSAMHDTYRLLNANGLNVLIHDYEGFGESFSLVARLETILEDANTALATAQARTGEGTDKIIVFGSSMGTMPAFAQAADMPDNVVAVIVEGSFNQSLPAIAYILLGLQPDPVSFSLIPDELDPLRNAPQVQLPTLFLHSRDDRTTPISGARALFDLVPAQKQFEELVGGHIASVTADPTYEDKLMSFIDDVLDGE